VGFNFPMLFSRIADAREWYDEKAQRFRIAVDVPAPPGASRVNAIAEPCRPAAAWVSAHREAERVNARAQSGTLGL